MNDAIHNAGTTNSVLTLEMVDKAINFLKNNAYAGWEEKAKHYFKCGHGAYDSVKNLCAEYTPKKDVSGINISNLMGMEISVSDTIPNNQMHLMYKTKNGAPILMKVFEFKNHGL